MVYNALLAGEHDWMKGKMPSGQPLQTPAMQTPAQAPKKSGRVMNALSAVFEYGAPEAFQQGYDRRTKKELGNMLASGDVSGAGRYAYQRGQLEAGDAYTSQATEQDKAKRQQEAQGIISLFSNGPEMVNQIAMQDPAGFERMTGMTSEEYLQTAAKFGDGGAQFAKYALAKAQAELGQGPPGPVEGKVVNDRLVNPFSGEVIGDFSDPAQANYSFQQIGEDIVAINPANPADRVVVGKAPPKTPLVNNSITLPDQKGETKFQEGLGTQAATNFQTIVDQGRAAGASIGNLDTMAALLDEIDYTGFGGDTLLNVQRAGAMLGIEIPDMPAKEAAQRLSKQMALALKTDLPGPMSNADREFLLSIPPNLNTSPEGNDAILFILRKREERKQDMMQSLLQANPQSMEEYRAWEQRYLSSTPPMFTPKTQASLLRALGSTPIADSPQ